MNLKKQAKIIEIMQRKNPISVKDLSIELECTEMTVRRNLDQMQEKGLLKREHGYAYLLDATKVTDYYAEENEHVKEKEVIASLAVRFIKTGMGICMDSGTTIQKLVDIIPDHYELSVITPSLIAAFALAKRKQIQVLMPGGFLHHANRSLLLDDTASLKKFHMDLAFISCRSLQIPGGTFEYNQSLTYTKRSLAAIAEKKILLLDYSKWNVSSIFSCIPLDQIDLIISDDKTPASCIADTERTGKELLIVSGTDGSIVNHINSGTSGLSLD